MLALLPSLLGAPTIVSSKSLVPDDKGSGRTTVIAHDEPEAGGFTVQTLSGAQIFNMTSFVQTTVDSLRGDE